MACTCIVCNCICPTNNSISFRQIISDFSSCCQVLINRVSSPCGWLDQHLKKQEGKIITRYTSLVLAQVRCYRHIIHWKLAVED